MNLLFYQPLSGGLVALLLILGSLSHGGHSTVATASSVSTPEQPPTCNESGFINIPIDDTTSDMMKVRAYHTVVNNKESNPKHNATPIVQWLIDSGCSTHMTPYFEDLIGDIERTDSNVEVATGVLTKAPLQGTVKIKIQDIYTNDSC